MFFEERKPLREQRLLFFLNTRFITNSEVDCPSRILERENINSIINTDNKDIVQ